MSDKSLGLSFPEFYQNNKFRDPMGRRLYQMLFWELSKDKTKALYTLKEQDHEGCKSLYRLYIDLGDPTEYTFANTYFDSFEHWTILTKRAWFIPFVSKWREELEVKLRSDALRRIIAEGKSGSKSAFMANKFILEKGWALNGKGRPTKADIKAAAHEAAQEDKQAQEDFLRVIGEK